MFVKNIIVFSVFFTFANAANILAIFAFPSESHHILGKVLTKNLAKKGHNVTYISAYPMKENITNLNHIIIDDMIRFKEDRLQAYMKGDLSLYERIKQFGELSYFSRAFFESKSIQTFLKSDSKYDVMIHFIAWDPSLSLAHHFDVPVIVFAPVGGFSMLNQITGNPAPYSYVPSPFLPFSDDMTFIERLINTVVDTSMYFLVIKLFGVSIANNGINEYLPTSPPMEELYKRIDLVLVNTHISTETPRPYVPNMIQIGGFHLQEPEELPKDLKKILDQATEGVVYFSFGTNVKISELPEETLVMLTQELGKIPFKVLWKSDVDIPNKAKNIEVRQWFPQRGVLAHPNVKLFISHGGYGGSTETLYYGVPMLCIPFFGDQPKNCGDAERDGYAISLLLTNLNRKSFSEALQKVLHDKNFIDSARFKSEVYRDQPINPMDNAAFWIEHVIKHKGAKHLKVKALNLSWYQYYLIDVMAFILVVISSILLIFYYTLKVLILKVCRRRSKVKVN